VQNNTSSSLQSKNIKIENYRSIILRLVHETWLLTLRKECGLRVFKNRVLKRIFWPERDKATGECKRLQNEGLNDCTPHQILFM